MIILMLWKLDEIMEMFLRDWKNTRRQRMFSGKCGKGGRWFLRNVTSPPWKLAETTGIHLRD
jgi:hypothetical protein